jgi:hypothetical protein
MSATALLLAMLAGPPAEKPAEMHTPIGSLIPRPRESIGETDVDTQRATEVMQKFAKCVVGKQPVRTAAYVDLPRTIPDTDRNARLTYFRREMSVCLGRLDGAHMQLKTDVMVGMLAEQLYLRKYPMLPELGRSAIPPAANPEQLATFTTLSFADCLVDRDSGAVDAAIRSTVNSAAEADAFRRISGSYAVCLDAGSVLKLNRLALRTALAEQLYRRALAGRAAQHEHAAREETAK